MGLRKRGLWGTRFGFYLAAIGSAFGLGNLWRFPYVTVENGGGAFVLLYVLFALIVGLPLLIGELMLGKLSRRTVISAGQRVSQDPALSRCASESGGTFLGLGIWIGRLSVVVCLFILAYYAVVSGWVLHFLMRFFFGHLTTGTFDIDSSLMILRDNGGLQIALTSVHILITLVIVAKGVQEGMEKWVSHIMPIFVVLLVVLVMKSLSLPSAESAMRFMFYPDFSALKPSSMLQALGHVFFTLSIGMGTMVTFGSYLNERTRIPSAGFRVTTMDTLISLFAGLLIFPLLMGAQMTTAGPELLFQTLPRLLLDLESGFIFGMAFFLCLYLAALGASIGLLESIVANLIDFRKLSRVKATWIAGGAALVIGIAPALSTSILRFVSFQGRGFLEILDGVLINWLLPVAALGVSVVMSSRLRIELMENEFANDDTPATRKLFSHWCFALRWIAPSVILVALGLAIWGQFQ